MLIHLIEQTNRYLLSYKVNILSAYGSGVEKRQNIDL